LRVACLEDRLALSSAPTPAVVPWLILASALPRQPRLADIPKAGPAVVFLGDSILARFAHGPGAAVWRDTVAPYGAVDFARGGSQTDNVLGDINQGELRGLAPSVIVLLIGTNNLGVGQSPAATAAGVAACLADIEAKQPGARILLLGLLPRGRSPDAPLRAGIAQTNGLLASQADGSRVSYLDLGSLFLGPGGVIPPALMPDGIHPSALGYQVLSAALQQPLQQLLMG
jgi:lysophospholipase L1-like esterase